MYGLTKNILLRELEIKSQGVHYYCARRSPYLAVVSRGHRLHTRSKTTSATTIVNSICVKQYKVETYVPAASLRLHKHRRGRKRAETRAHRRAPPLPRGDQPQQLAL